jgi:hypothetical protein
MCATGSDARYNKGAVVSEALFFLDKRDLKEGAIALEALSKTTNSYVWGKTRRILFLDGHLCFVLYRRDPYPYPTKISVRSDKALFHAIVPKIVLVFGFLESSQIKVSRVQNGAEDARLNRYRRAAGPVGDRATSSMPTRVTTTVISVWPCASDGSSPASPAVVPSPRTAWEATAGWSNGRLSWLNRFRHDRQFQDVS